MRRGLKWLPGATLGACLLLSTGTPRISNAALFDGTAEGTPTLISADPVKIVDSRHYRNRFQLAITPQTPQVLLGIRAGAPGTATIRLTTTVYGSSIVSVSTEERLMSISFDGIGNFSLQNVVVVPGGVAGHDSTLSVQPFLPVVLQAEMTTPADFDRVLVEIEVFASRPMTFIEHW